MWMRTDLRRAWIELATVIQSKANTTRPIVPPHVSWVRCRTYVRRTRAISPTTADVPCAPQVRNMVRTVASTVLRVNIRPHTMQRATHAPEEHFLPTRQIHVHRLASQLAPRTKFFVKVRSKTRTASIALVNYFPLMIN